jgi:curved DNA-binding protein CbpA
MKTLYDLLGVRPDADDTTMRAAFRKAAKAYHPDANAGDRGVEQLFREITAAHAVLRDPQRRAEYDRALGRRRQRLMREWKITLAGWGLSAVMSAGVVSASVLVLPKWLWPSNLVGSSIESRFPGKNDDKSAVTPTAAEDAGKPNEEVSVVPPTSGQTAGQGVDKQHDPAPPDITASVSTADGTRQRALADTSRDATPMNPQGRAPESEPDRSPTKDGAAAMKGIDGRRETRLEAVLFGNDRLADSLLRTHIFDRGEVDQILGFAEAAPDQPIEESSPEKFHHNVHSVKHHHHRDRRTAFRHGRARG